MGKKILGIFILFLFIYLYFPEKVASTTVAEDSAQIRVSSFYQTEDLNQKYLFKKLAIKKILEDYHSPLIDSLDQFLNVCHTYEIDCYLLPAIAGVESSFGLFIYHNSYNPFGWGGGYIVFKNWDEAIEIVGKNLKTNYIQKGATTVNQIGAIYAQSPTWPAKVNFFINKLEREEEKIRLSFWQNRIEL